MFRWLKWLQPYFWGVVLGIIGYIFIMQMNYILSSKDYQLETIGNVKAKIGHVNSAISMDDSPLVMKDSLNRGLEPPKKGFDIEMPNSSIGANFRINKPDPKLVPQDKNKSLRKELIALKNKGIIDSELYDFLLKNVLPLKVKLEVFERQHDNFEKNFLTKKDARAQFLKGDYIKEKFVRKGHAKKTFLNSRDARETFLSKEDAQTTFVSKRDLNSYIWSDIGSSFKSPFLVGLYSILALFFTVLLWLLRQKLVADIRAQVLKEIKHDVAKTVNEEVSIISQKRLGVG